MPKPRVYRSAAEAAYVAKLGHGHLVQIDPSLTANGEGFLIRGTKGFYCADGKLWTSHVKCIKKPAGTDAGKFQLYLEEVKDAK